MYAMNVLSPAPRLTSFASANPRLADAQFVSGPRYLKRELDPKVECEEGKKMYSVCYHCVDMIWRVSCGR